MVQRASAPWRLSSASPVCNRPRSITPSRLSQSAAAGILRVNQSEVSPLVTGRLSGFSLERLIHFLTLREQDVTISVTETSPATT
jgi:hypothetical protein